MSEILSIENLKQLVNSTIEIPGFNIGQKILVKVQRPNIMNLLAQERIPNHLVSKVNEMFIGETKERDKMDENAKAREVVKIYELYCEICLVEPTYQEMKSFITDEQMEAIFDWATKDVRALDSFRKNEEDGTDYHDGTEVS